MNLKSYFKTYTLVMAYSAFIVTSGLMITISQEINITLFLLTLSLTFLSISGAGLIAFSFKNRIESDRHASKADDIGPSLKPDTDNIVTCDYFDDIAEKHCLLLIEEISKRGLFYTSKARGEDN